MFARSTKSGSELAKSGPDFDCLWRLLVRQKRRSNGGIRGPILRNSFFFRNIFLGQIYYNFMRVTFTINIDFVSV